MQDAAPAAAKGAPRAEGIDAELDAAHAAWLPDGTALLMLRSGQMLLVSLHAEGGVVRRIQERAKSWLSSRLPRASNGHRAGLYRWLSSSLTTAFRIQLTAAERPAWHPTR